MSTGIIIAYIIGVICGGIATAYFCYSRNIEGVIEIDHKNNTCKFLCETEELVNLKNDKVVFLISHIK